MNETGTDTQAERLSNSEIFRRLLALSWSYRTGCIKAISIQIVLFVFALAGLNFMGVGIDFLNHRLNPSSKPPSWPLGFAPPSAWTPMEAILLISGMIIALALVRSVLSYYYSITITKLLQQGIVVDLRARVYDKLQRMSFRFFDSRTSSTLINRVTGDVQSVRLFVDGVIIQGTILVVSLAVYVIYMLSIHVKLTLACMSMIPAMALASFIFSRKLRPSYAKDRELSDKLILDICEATQGIHVVKGFNREPDEIAKVARSNAAVRDQKYRIIMAVSTFGPGMEFLTQMNIMILLGYGGYLVATDVLPLGTGLIVFLGLLQRFSAQVNVITGVVDNIQQSLTAAGRVFEILEMRSDVDNCASPARIGKSRGDLSFRKVGFWYEPGEPVLRGIDFAVTPGQSVGILGTTGSGKSTLLSLIPRFYDVKEGDIMLDGLNLRDIDLEDLRKNVGLVFQESFLFSNTVAANIAFGHPKATREQVEKAAKIASAHDFIMRLAQGYDTVIGEAGSDLSGGQRQRLAIARAVLLEPPILLLDDPTAAVDPETENEILEAIDGVMKGRTTFIVSHRINVLRRCDIILVLHKGQIAQRGTHDELMRMKGHYSRTANIQMLDENVPPQT